MSQLTKTIKMALKSTEEERAMLRARSAVQRFPVVEWRQRMEDFHKRSINTSRGIASSNAWRPSDADFVPGSMHVQEPSSWEPEYQAYPSQPDWDSRSLVEGHSPRMSSMPNTPGSPGQWNQDPMTPSDPHLAAPPRLLGDGRRGSFSTDVSDNEGDYFSNNHSQSEVRQDFGNFLERANKTIARDQRHAPDPFLDASSAPSRPFGAHSRVSSVESISSIVDEKQNSPLNKAIASVRMLASDDEIRC